MGHLKRPASGAQQIGTVVKFLFLGAGPSLMQVLQSALLLRSSIATHGDGFPEACHPAHISAAASFWAARLRAIQIAWSPCCLKLGDARFGAHWGRVRLVEYSESRTIFACERQRSLPKRYRRVLLPEVPGLFRASALQAGHNARAKQNLYMFNFCFRKVVILILYF